MTKEEAKNNIEKRIEDMYYKDEVNAFVKGYLTALRDAFEIDKYTYWELEEELMQ